MKRGSETKKFESKRTKTVCSINLNNLQQHQHHSRALLNMKPEALPQLLISGG